MGKVTFSYVVYATFAKSDGTIPIKLRVTWNKKSTYLATDLIASPGDYVHSADKKNLKLKNNRLRFVIEELIKKYSDAADKCRLVLDMNPGMTVNDVVKLVRKQFDTPKQFRLNFVQFCSDFIEEKKKTSKKAAGNYVRAIKLLSDFMGKGDFDISEITSSRLNEFTSFLKKRYGENARTVSMVPSHIKTMHKEARHKYNSEEMDAVFIRNPFDYYICPKQSASRHINVDAEIIQGMINDYQSTEGRVRLAVAAFLLSFGLMGINTPDLYECTEDKDCVHYFRRKTQGRRYDKAEMLIRIPSCLNPLIEEYRDDSGNRAFNFYKRYRRYENMEDAEIKGMHQYAEKIGYKDKLSYYCARHTWATLARSSRCNIEKATVDECLAHKGEHPVADVYIKRDYSRLWAANEQVLSLFDWGPLNNK